MASAENPYYSPPSVEFEVLDAGGVRRGPPLQLPATPNDAVEVDGLALSSSGTTIAAVLSHQPQDGTKRPYTSLEVVSARPGGPTADRRVDKIDADLSESFGEAARGHRRDRRHVDHEVSALCTRGDAARAEEHFFDLRSVGNADNDRIDCGRDGGGIGGFARAFGD